MTRSVFPSGFKDGIILRGLPLTTSYPGKIFWVGNGLGASTPSATYLQGQKTASDGNAGTFNAPFATLDYAIGMCSTGRGDVIMIKPNHSETISSATALALDVASVAIIGLGYGNNRPLFTLDTATTTTINVSAANVSIQNCRFVANFADIATCFNVANATVTHYLTIENCDFVDTSSVLNFVAIVTIGTTANIADGFAFSNNLVHGLATTAATTALKFASDTKKVVLSDNFIVYPVLNDTPVLADLGSVNHTAIKISGNKVFRPNTSSTNGTLFASSSSACTGIVCDNYVWHLDNSAGLMAPTGTKLGFFRNFCMITGAADKSALENPAAV